MRYVRFSQQGRLVSVGMLAGVLIVAAACGGGTSSTDKTSTARAGAAASSPAATKSAATSAATPGKTGTAASATTPAAGSTTPAAGATSSGTTGGGVKVADSTLGKILVDARGFTLYTYANDVANSGKSAAEALTAAWPPLTLDAAPSAVAGATGEWTIFTRADGKKQVAYKGMPLYFFANDKAAGDTKGDKVGNVWFVAVP